MRLDSPSSNFHLQIQYNHCFPQIVDNYAKYGKVEKIIGRDGIQRTKISLEGSYIKNNGYFEWIIEPDNSIKHRFFKKK